MLVFEFPQLQIICNSLLGLFVNKSLCHEFKKLEYIVDGNLSVFQISSLKQSEYLII